MASRLGIRGRTVDLYVRFVDAAGNPVNTDETPTVAITDSAGASIRTASNLGISLVDDPGLYLLTYSIPLATLDGYSNDTWAAIIGGETITTTFEFQVMEGGTATAVGEPNHTPGDTVEFNFSQEEIAGMNILLKVLKKRLKSSGQIKQPAADGSGNYEIVDCPIFTDEELICFLVNGLSGFNQFPHFTAYTFADSQIQGLFMDVVIQGAVLLALAAQALIERGREFSITDNGVTYQPPAVSEMLATQYTAQLTDYNLNWQV